MRVMDFGHEVSRACRLGVSHEGGRRIWIISGISTKLKIGVHSFIGVWIELLLIEVQVVVEKKSVVEIDDVEIEEVVVGGLLRQAYATVGSVIDVSEKAPKSAIGPKIVLSPPVEFI